MKKVLLVMVLLSVGAYAESFKNVSLVDKMCAANVKNNPDEHSRDCALQCSKSGYGILTSDGKFLKFDKQGDEQALKLLKASNKPDHLRVNVDGDVKGDTLAVKSISF